MILLISWQSFKVIDVAFQRQVDSDEFTKFPPIVYGTTEFPVQVDPHFSDDYQALSIIDIIFEGLFTFEWINNSRIIVPQLAAENEQGNWSEDGLQFTVKIKKNVIFHNDEIFTVHHIMNSFDRLLSILSTSDQENSRIYKLFAPRAEQFPSQPLVINRTESVSEDSIKFVLNYPFGAFKSLLCSSGARILPLAVPKDRALLINSDGIYGTGPLYLSKYTDAKLEFRSFPKYYDVLPEIRELSWILYADSITMNQAVIAMDIDIISRKNCIFYEEFLDSEYHSNDEFYSNLTTDYIRINSDRVGNSTRKAIYHGFNRNIIGNVLNSSDSSAISSLIPNNLMIIEGLSIISPYNQTLARKYILEAITNNEFRENITFSLNENSSDASWENKTLTDPLAYFQIVYPSQNSNFHLVCKQLQNDFKKLGINLTLNRIDTANFKSIDPLDYELIWTEITPILPDSYNFYQQVINKFLIDSNFSLNYSEVLNDWYSIEMEWNDQKRSDLIHSLDQNILQIYCLALPIIQKKEFIPQCYWLSDNGSLPISEIDFLQKTYDGPKKISFLHIHSHIEETNLFLIVICCGIASTMMWGPLLYNRWKKRDA
ncbi:ABC transporter substrate-binding protein [Candidatus Lokiarchaeum ossiferum]|uniref:ABC transporter substrate-binding protein n=1 Tax=Candidatus Lokiarchaeum ossiferum TaxID=2951803 RepID=UPI00352BEEE2